MVNPEKLNQIIHSGKILLLLFHYSLFLWEFLEKTSKTDTCFFEYVWAFLLVETIEVLIANSQANSIARQKMAI